MTRILFTSHPASGHLRPLVPIATAATAHGHEVAVLAPEALATELREYGIAHSVGGYDWRDEVIQLLPKNYRTMSILESAEILCALGDSLTEAFAGHIARATAADVLSAAEQWKPDLIVRELDELGGYLAAEALGIPHVSVASFGGLEGVTAARLGPILATGRRELGLVDDPEGASLYRYLHANFLPPTYSATEMILPNTRCYRHPNVERRAGRLPEWMADLDLDRPVIFAGFGTVIYGLPGAQALAADTISALGELACTAVVAVGSGGSPQAYGTVPENVRLVDFVEQPLILEGADLFITHGGLNSMKDAMRLGIPMVCVPVLGDHRHNAAQAEAAGVARTVPLAEAEASSLASACREVLSNSEFRRGSRRLQRQIHALPSVERLVDDLEWIAAQWSGVSA